MAKSRYYITTIPKIKDGYIVWSYRITFFDSFDRLEKEVESDYYHEEESGAYNVAKAIAEAYVDALKSARCEEFRYESKY